MSITPSTEFPFTKSETGRLIQEMDWTDTPLGSMTQWPQSLITTLNICLSAPHPITIFYGKDLIQIYNDQYRVIIGDNHPSIFGKPFKESGKEIWHQLSPVIEDEVYNKGKSFCLKDEIHLINRSGSVEEAYFSSSFSPMYNEENEISGVICILQETTLEVINKRHLILTSLLAERISSTETINHIFKKAMEVLKTAERDFPYAAVYSLRNDATKAVRLDYMGLPSDHELIPSHIDLKLAGFLVDAINRTVFSKDVFVLDHDKPVRRLMNNIFESKIFKTLLFPIQQKGNSAPIAVVMIGLNPYIRLDEAYMQFFKMIMVQLEQEVNISKTNLESKQAEKKLRESEDHYRLATEVTRLATWDLNLATFELTHSPRFAEILGYDSKRIITHQMMHDHIHPEDLYPVVESAFDTALQTALYNYDSRIIWPDKTLHWIRTQGKVLYDDQNIPIRMIGIMMDITEFKNAEQALRESEKRFRTVADTAPVMIWMSDRDKNCIFLNKCWSTVTGIAINDGLDNGWTHIVHPDDYPETSAKFAKAYKTHSVYTQELRIKDKNGDYIWIMDHAVPRYSAEGFFLGYIGSSININEQKNAKEVLEKKVIERTLALKQANEELKRTNKELEQFAYVSSHDLQEPLRKIQTFSELLSNRIDETHDTERIYLDKINSSAVRMSELIRDLLNLSRVSNVDEEFMDTDLSKTIENIKNDLEVLIEEKHAELYIEKMPVIKAIPIQMNQLFFNLLSNALKFSEKTPVIHILCKEVAADQLKRYNIQEDVKKEKFIQITVKDNGVGFDQAYAEQIFVIFQRLNDRSKFAGTGIGLAICKKIVDNHNGFIIAESKVNVGSTFNIFLPN